MSYSYEAILSAQAQRIAAERSQQVAELEAGRMAEDPDRVAYAANRILELDAQEAALAQRANTYYTQAPAMRQNPHGLTDDEVEVARNSFTRSDMNLSDEQRLELYARQKARLQELRRTGQYRDDQGTVWR